MSKINLKYWFTLIHVVRSTLAVPNLATSPNSELPSTNVPAMDDAVFQSPKAFTGIFGAKILMFSMPSTMRGYQTQLSNHRLRPIWWPRALAYFHSKTFDEVKELPPHLAYDRSCNQIEHSSGKSLRHVEKY